MPNNPAHTLQEETLTLAYKEEIASLREDNIPEETIKQTLMELHGISEEQVIRLMAS